jgi:hypothetical protein
MHEGLPQNQKGTCAQWAKSGKWSPIKDFLQYSLLTNEKREVKIRAKDLPAPWAKGFGDRAIRKQLGITKSNHGQWAISS